MPCPAASPRPGGGDLAQADCKEHPQGALGFPCGVRSRPRHARDPGADRLQADGTYVPRGQAACRAVPLTSRAVPAIAGVRPLLAGRQARAQLILTHRAACVCSPRSPAGRATGSGRPLRWCYLSRPELATGRRPARQPRQARPFGGSQRPDWVHVRLCHPGSGNRGARAGRAGCSRKGGMLWGTAAM